MKNLILLALLLTVPSLCSCTLAGRLIQAPVRLIQAGVRTVTDVGEKEAPATADSLHLHGIALSHSATTQPRGQFTAAPSQSGILPENPAPSLRGQLQTESQGPSRK